MVKSLFNRRILTEGEGSLRLFRVASFNKKVNNTFKNKKGADLN